MRGCLRPHLLLDFEETVFRSRSVAHKRLFDHFLLLSGTPAIFEVAYILVYQSWFLVILFAILKDLRVLSYLHKELILILRARILLPSLQRLAIDLQLDSSRVVNCELLAREVVDRGGLDGEASRFAALARR